MFPQMLETSHFASFGTKMKILYIYIYDYNDYILSKFNEYSLIDFEVDNVTYDVCYFFMLEFFD